MLSKAWEEDDKICFFSHSEGCLGIDAVRVKKYDLMRYPVYHIKWKAGKATYEMTVDKKLTPDSLIQQLSAVRLPV